MTDTSTSRKNRHSIFSVILGLAIILSVPLWRTAAYPLILGQEIAFDSEDTISIPGAFETEDIHIYNTKDKAVRYTHGVDYIITQKTQEAIIKRLEGGDIPPRGMVFVYIDGKDKEAVPKQYINEILILREADKMGIAAPGLSETGQTEDTLSIKLYKADIKTYPIVGVNATNHVEDEIQGSAATGNSTSSCMEFQTFKDTGEDICRDDMGLPIIILFSSPECPHCIWIGETFDSTVREYAEKGLIKAHHYVIDNNDDLLTTAVETEIPQTYLEIGQVRNPNGYMPYFNFGCRYDRIGNGYEVQDDLAGEAMEFRQVIDALLLK